MLHGLTKVKSRSCTVALPFELLQNALSLLTASLRQKQESTKPSQTCLLGS